MEQLDDSAFPGELHARLTDFLARLRLRGLSVNQDQEVRLFELLSRLTAAGHRFQTAGEFSNHIVPILAGNAEQQKLCQDILHESYGAKVSPIENASPARDFSRSDQSLVHQVLTQLARVRTIATFVVGALLIWGAIVVYQSWPDTNASGGGTNNVPKRIPNTLVSMDWIYEIPIKELEPPKQSWRNRTVRWYYAEYDWKKGLAAVGPWVVYAAVLSAMIWAVLAHLQRERARQNLADLPFSFKGDRPRFGERYLLSGLQPLRRVAREHLYRFDSEASIEATARAGGRPMARFEKQPIPVEFATFVDKRNPRDHFAAFGEIFFRTLDEAGIPTEKYTFDTTPDIVSQASTGRIDTAESVLNSLSDAIILVLLTEDEIFDPLTGDARDWIGVFGARNRTFLFVPESQAHAGDIHDVLPPGVSVLPATPAGLRSMVSTLTKDGSGPPRVSGRLHPLDRLYAELSEQPDHWTQSTPLPKAETTKLLAKLERAAGPENMRWIGATSVYPEVRWPITLRLRDRLDGRRVRQAELNSDLLRIVQLPWFRQGRMPDWLRTRMIEGLPAKWTNRVREVLLNAIGIDGSRDTAPLNVAQDMRAEMEMQDPVRTDHIMLRYLFAGQRLPRGAFSLPQDLERKFRRRPMRKLLFAGATGAILATGGSLIALSQLPINECDLLGSTRYAPDRIGTGWMSDFPAGEQLLDRVSLACEKAAHANPNSLRFQYQQAYVELQRENSSDQQKEVLIGEIYRLADEGYAPALNYLGYLHQEKNDLGFEQNDLVAVQYFERAYQSGSAEALGNLGRAYARLAQTDDNYIETRKKIVELHFELGGLTVLDYAQNLREGSGGFEADHKKYLDVLRGAIRRGDGRSATVLGVHYHNGEYVCGSALTCEPDYETARKYYRLATALNGSEYAAYNLANHYYHGIGVTKNLDEAFYWSVYAARLEHDRAMPLLLQVLGESTAQQRESWGVNLAKIINSIRKLADSIPTEGVKDKATYAQYYLGRYFETTGDIDQALQYYKRAEQSGHPLAADDVWRLE